MVESLPDAIMEIKEGEALRVTQDRLKAGDDPSEILDDVRKGVQKAVGRCERGEYGRMELQMIHLIVDKCFNLLSPHLKKQPSLGRVLTGTLITERDEMGRDITPLILLSAGFDVTDLGSQVHPQEFVKKAEEIRPDLVAISGVDGESLEEASQAVSSLARLRSSLKVMIGPLVKCGQQLLIDEDVVRTLKADRGWNDPVEAVGVAKSLLEERVKVVES